MRVKVKECDHLDCRQLVPSRRATPIAPIIIWTRLRDGLEHDILQVLGHRCGWFVPPLLINLIHVGAGVPSLLRGFSERGGAPKRDGGIGSQDGTLVVVSSLHLSSVCFGSTF